MQMLMRIVIIVLLSFLTIATYAQSSRKKKKKEQESAQPTTIDPSLPQQDYAPKKTRKSDSKKIEYENPHEEFAARMEELKKEKRRNERMMDDPQYSDPTYFGHKRPPKRHKPGKMKYCKVCGIRH